MKKLERFKFIQDTFGQEYVPEYFACYNLEQISKAGDYFNSKGLQWCLRTDTRTNFIGSDQAKLSPFVFLCSEEKARDIWQLHGERLVYIVFRAMPTCFLNGVARKMDDETVLFEINEKEPDIPQRYMYRNPNNLSHLLVGQFRRSRSPHLGYSWPTFLPHDSTVVSRGLDEVYELIFSTHEEEITFAIRYPDRQLIIW